MPDLLLQQKDRMLEGYNAGTVIVEALPDVDAGRAQAYSAIISEFRGRALFPLVYLACKHHRDIGAVIISDYAGGQRCSDSDLSA